MKDRIAEKQAIFQACIEYIDERLANIQRRIKAIEESRNQETKSSVGDKHETGRAMMQLEEEKASHQLQQAKAVKTALLRIASDKVCTKVEPGSLVVTSQGIYYIAIGIGKLKLSEQQYFCISIDAPIGKLLRHRQAGESVKFNGRDIQILEIF